MKRFLHSEIDILPVPHQTDEKQVTSVPDLGSDNDSSELPNSINETEDINREEDSTSEEEEEENAPPPSENKLDSSINEQDADKIVISIDKCDIAENSPSTDEEESESEDFVIPDCFITDEQTIREQLALDEPLASLNHDKVMETFEESTDPSVAAGIEFDDFVSCSFESVERQPIQEEVNELEFNFFMNTKANIEEHQQQQPPTEEVTMSTQQEQTANEDDDFSDFVSTAVPTEETEMREDDNEFEPFAEYVSSDGDSVRNAAVGINEEPFEVEEVECWNEIFKTASEVSFREEHESRVHFTVASV